MANPNLIRQIEYYLSEENLQNDEFFYKEVAATPYILLNSANTSSSSMFFSSATKSRSLELLQPSKSLRRFRSVTLLSLTVIRLLCAQRSFKIYLSSRPRRRPTTMKKQSRMSTPTTTSKCTILII